MEAMATGHFPVSLQEFCQIMKRFTFPLSGWRLGAAALLLLSLSGCGGSSSKSPTPVPTIHVTGIVTDPAIQGAVVRLNDANGDALASVVTTDDNGRVTFTGLTAAQLSDATIQARGGRDVQTGTDFTGLTLSAPYQASGSLFVAPLTTLVMDEMAAGADLSTATATIAARFGLTPAQVMADPASDAAVQKTALQLSSLAAALRAYNGFTRLATLTAAHGNDWQAIANDVANDNELPQQVKNRVTELVSELALLQNIDTSLSAAATLAEANRLRMVAGVKRFLSNALAYAPSEAAEARIESFAASLLQANAGRGLATDSAAFANLIRYAFGQYGLTSASFEDDSWTVPAALASDAQIARIARLNVIDHTLPLTADEYLTSNEAKRAYFYASDLAPAYRALNLFSDVLDDNITDDIFGSIAASYALRGMPEEADLILNSQIFSPFWVAEGFRRVGNAYASLGDIPTAQTYWEQAISRGNAYMADKGWANLSADDASFFQALAGTLGNYGFTERANEVLEPVNAFIASNTGTYTTAYGRIVTAIRNQVNAAIEDAEAAGMPAGLKADALNQANLYSSILDGVGLQSATSSCGDHYMLRALFLTGLADYYMRLGETEKVRSSINRFVDLRASHACTSTRTNVYVRYLVEEFAYLNDLAGYLTLVDTTMTDATANQKTDALTAAAQYEAVDLAKAGDVEGALAKITTTVPNDRMEQLTNVGLSESSVNARLAVSLIQAGATQAAAAVLDEAWALAQSEAFRTANLNDGTAYTRYGCGKVARLTYKYIDQATGISRLNTCATLVEAFESVATTEAISYAYTYLAENALQINQNHIAVSAYNKAIQNGELLIGSARINAVGEAIYFPLINGAVEAGVDINSMLTSMQGLEAIYREAADAAAVEADFAASALMARSIVSRYGQMSIGLRSQVVSAEPANNLSQTLHTIRSRASAIALDAERVASRIATVNTRNSHYGYLIGSTGGRSYLANTGLYETGIELLDLMGDTESVSGINTYRLALAKHWLAHDEFPGSDVAFFDQDNDGLADFFEAGISAEAITASGIQADDDIDNDGIADSMDSTPFYCETCEI